MATTGSLSYDFSNKNFLVNRTGTDDGWVSLPISPSAENITQEDLKTWANKLGGQNQSRLYVDIGNPLASDSKNNRGNSQLRPFRSIERALAEVARISFKKNPAGNSTPNDAFERITISIAPGEYEVQNGPRSKLGVFNNYGRYQDAAFLIGERKDSIVDNSFAVITSPYNTSLYKQDLDYFLNAIIKDLSTGGNVYTLRVAQTLVTSDESVGYNGPNDPQSGYFVTRYSGAAAAARTQLVTALNALAIEAKAAMRDATGYDIILDNASPTCQDVADSIDTLTNIIINTFNCGIDPRDATLIKYGAYSANEFPVSEPSKADLQRFNSIDNAGIILPRGVSIVGEDLRKVVIRPTYVPDPTDPLAGRGAIFRMTGGNFFSGFTIKDQKLKNTANPSHHKLTVFEFCSEEDLESYYTDIDIAFSDPNVYNRALDAANLLEKNEKWIAENFDFPNNDYGLVFESESEQLIIAIQKDLRGITNKNVIEFGKKFHNAHIAPLEVNTQASARDTYHNLLDDLYSDYLVRAISNLGGVVDLEVIDSGTESEVFNGVRAEPFVGRCADIQAVLYTYIEAVKALITDPAASIAEGLSRQAFAFEPSDIEVRDPENSIVLGLTAAEEANPPGADKINTVFGASPYIFSASIRSEYGMCGIDGDGSKVTGLKSYLAAQFTIVSLQKDPAAFVEDTVEVGGNRYRGSKIADSVDYTHFGYRVSNGAYSQLVSCFCIGPARHYVAESGGEFSVTNSTSNFGDISLFSKGYNTTDLAGNIDGIGAYLQDKDHKLIGILRPKNFDFNEDNAQSFSLSTVIDYKLSDSSTEPSFDDNTWYSEKSEWKNWVNKYAVADPQVETIDYGSLGEIDRQVNYYDMRFPIYAQEFSAIKYAKITISGKVTRSNPHINFIEDPNDPTKLLPDLGYVYLPAPSSENVAPTLTSSPITIDFSNRDGSDPDERINRPTDNSETPIDYLASGVQDGLNTTYDENTNQLTGYNANLVKPRRAKVLSLKENDQGNTELILDLTEGPEIVGEWFERESLKNNDNSTRPNPVNSKLTGLNLFIKRFVDDRSYEDRKYKLIFQRKDNTKRLPPSNFILRKQTGITSSSDQPFDSVIGDKNRVFYAANISSLSNIFIQEYSPGDPGSLEDFNSTDTLLFTSELLSADSDGEFRPQTDDDLFENSKFLWKIDAEIISKDYTQQERNNLLINVTTSKESNELDTEGYISKKNIERILDLSGDNGFDISNPIGYIGTEELNRVFIFNDTSKEYAFAKPSVIRASGQTWEYMGYYNYSTGIPIYQKENLGDGLQPKEAKRFRLEKIQKAISGGRIYATGMDELGNVIQGSNILDLKTGKTETLVTGTSEIVSAELTDEETILQSQTIIPTKFDSLETNELTVRTAVNFGDAVVTLPDLVGGEGEASSIIFSQKSVTFDADTITATDAALSTSTIRETGNTLGFAADSAINFNGVSSVSFETNTINVTGEIDPSKIGFAEATNSNDVSLTTLNNSPTDKKYITPKTLELWRVNRGLVSSVSNTSDQTRVCVQQNVSTTIDANIDANITTISVADVDGFDKRGGLIDIVDSNNPDVYEVVKYGGIDFVNKAFTGCQRAQKDPSTSSETTAKAFSSGSKVYRSHRFWWDKPYKDSLQAPITYTKEKVESLEVDYNLEDLETSGFDSVKAQIQRYISDGFVPNPMVAKSSSYDNQFDSEGNFDPEASGPSKKFKPFSTMEQAREWVLQSGFSPQDEIELLMKPGYYDISRPTLTSLVKPWVTKLKIDGACLDNNGYGERSIGGYAGNDSVGNNSIFLYLNKSFARSNQDFENVAIWRHYNGLHLKYGGSFKKIHFLSMDEMWARNGIKTFDILNGFKKEVLMGIRGKTDLPVGHRWVYTIYKHLEFYRNYYNSNAIGTLNGTLAIDGTSLVINRDNNVEWVPQSYYHFQIGSEVLRCQAISAGNETSFNIIQRGVGSTDAAAHSDGADIHLVLYSTEPILTPDLLFNGVIDSDRPNLILNGTSDPSSLSFDTITLGAQHPSTLINTFGVNRSALISLFNTKVTFKGIRLLGNERWAFVDQAGLYKFNSNTIDYGFCANVFRLTGNCSFSLGGGVTTSSMTSTVGNPFFKSWSYSPINNIYLDPVVVEKKEDNPSSFSCIDLNESNTKALLVEDIGTDPQTIKLPTDSVVSWPDSGYLCLGDIEQCQYSNKTDQLDGNTTLDLGTRNENGWLGSTDIGGDWKASTVVRLLGAIRLTDWDSSEGKWSYPLSGYEGTAGTDEDDWRYRGPKFANLIDNLDTENASLSFPQYEKFRTSGSSTGAPLQGFVGTFSKVGGELTSTFDNFFTGFKLNPNLQDSPSALFEIAPTQNNYEIGDNSIYISQDLEDSRKKLLGTVTCASDVGGSIVTGVQTKFVAQLGEYSHILINNSDSSSFEVYSIKQINSDTELILDDPNVTINNTSDIYLGGLPPSSSYNKIKLKTDLGTLDLSNFFVVDGYIHSTQTSESMKIVSIVSFTTSEVVLEVNRGSLNSKLEFIPFLSSSTFNIYKEGPGSHTEFFEKRLSMLRSVFSRGTDTFNNTSSSKSIVI